MTSEIEESKNQQLRRATKLNSAASKVVSNKNNFEESADLTFNKIKNKKEKATELVYKFWEFVKDTKLNTQKGPLEKNLEKEIVSELINFASEMNNDTAEPEGSGSVAIITLLLKSTLYIRDIINNLKYEIFSFKNENFKDLNERINCLEKQVLLLKEEISSIKKSI